MKVPIQHKRKTIAAVNPPVTSRRITLKL